MPRKPAHEQFDTLKVIEDCSFELFGRYGYDGVSIGDISKAARLSKSALYWHFQGKEELYLHCQQRLHRLFETHVFEPMRQELQPLRGVQRLFDGLRTLMMDPQVARGIAGYWLTPSMADDARPHQSQRAFEAAAVATVRGVLQKASDRGDLDLGRDLDDLPQAMISLVEACVLPLRHLRPDEMHRTLDVLARSLFRAYARSDDARALTRAI